MKRGQLESINFQQFGGPVFVGRANGAEARRKLGIDELDAAKNPIPVLIPPGTYAVNSSFFLGLFGPSLSHFESGEAFLRHYPLNGPDHVVGSLRDVINRALMSRGRLTLSS
jgi:hypothetical protein